MICTPFSETLPWFPAQVLTGTRKYQYCRRDVVNIPTTATPRRQTHPGLSAHQHTLDLATLLGTPAKPNTYQVGRRPFLLRPPARCLSDAGLFLRRDDRVLAGLRDTELYNSRCRDLDRLPRSRVPSHTGLSACLHQPTDAGYDEDSVLLHLLDSEGGQVVQKLFCDPFIEFALGCKIGHDLRLSHLRCCHTSPFRTPRNKGRQSNDLKQE